MENRKAKSQPSLPQRRWGSSIEPYASSMQRSQSMSAAHGGRRTTLRELGEQPLPKMARPMSSLLSQQPPRPMSSMPTRPESRGAASRPPSRPPSRLGARTPLAGDTQETLLSQRPKSGTVRPLSGRVFIRRTADKGWVAKHYPQQAVAQSQELDIFDDVSDNESLDSFFDDDFDSAEQGEKLQNLLSCNTLGVESKGTKQDWISGDVGTPKFHCPRCRDHWYGITPFPCDEELARLIREGLWYTGKGEVGDIFKNSKDPRSRIRPGSSIKREHSNSSSSVSLTKLPGGGRYGKKNDKGDSQGSITGDGDNAKKKKKRITFKLDLEDSGDSSAPSSTTLLQGEGGGGHHGIGAAKGILKGTSRASGQGGAGESGLETSESNESLMTKGGGTGSGGGSGLGSSNALSQGGRKKGRGGGGRGGFGSKAGSSHDLDSSSDGSGLLDSGSNKRGKRKKRNKTDTGNEKDGSGSDGFRDSGLGRPGEMDSKHNKTDSESNSKYNIDTGSNSGAGSLTTGNTGDASLHDENLLRNSGSNTNLASSRTSQGSQRGEGRKPPPSNILGNKDHGKNVRKPGGYMRAVSPTSSEWGDPLHARSFISSTATSRTGSTSNLLRDDEDEIDGGEGSTPTLPPIVPPIKKKPVVDLSDLLDGFQFTRPWTFSYHNSGPITAKLSQRL